MALKGLPGEVIPKGYRKASLQNYTPEAMQQYKSQFKHIDDNSYLSRLAGGDESMFEEMEAPAMRQFQGLQGQIGSRYSGMGMGGQKSSSFQNEQNQAASDFAQDLQGKRMSLRNQAIKDLMGMSNTLLGQEPYQNYAVQKQPKEGFDWGGLAGGALGGIGGFLAGGPIGAMTGAQVGYGIGSGKGGGSYQSGQGWNSQGGNTGIQTQRLTR